MELGIAKLFKELIDSALKADNSDACSCEIEQLDDDSFALRVEILNKIGEETFNAFSFINQFKNVGMYKHPIFGYYVIG